MDNITDLPSTVTVSRLSLGTIIVYFVLYIVSHLFIGYKYKDAKEKATKNPGNKQLAKEEKIWMLIFRWYPAAYVLIILLTL